MIEQSEDAFAFDVTRCRYAEFYKELGEPELGFLLVCTADFATAEGFGGDIKLTRTQTIMQGAPHCDFSYRRVKGVTRCCSAAGLTHAKQCRVLAGTYGVRWHFCFGPDLPKESLEPWSNLVCFS